MKLLQKYHPLCFLVIFCLQRVKIILAHKPKVDYIIIKAEVVELADTLCSGRSACKGMWVQIPPSAQIQTKSTVSPFITSFKNLHFIRKFLLRKGNIGLYLNCNEFGAGWVSFGPIKVSCYF
jgi:hypothetical protein